MESTPYHSTDLALANILREAILEIRSLGRSRDAARIVKLADAIHNISSGLVNHNLDLELLRRDLEEYEVSGPTLFRYVKQVDAVIEASKSLNADTNLGRSAHDILARGSALT